MLKKTKHEKGLALKIRELESLWDSFSIPEEIRWIYRELIDSAPSRKLEKFVEKEVSAFKTNSALILNCLNAILAREESLKSIHDLNTYLSTVKNWSNLSEIKKECSEVLNAYRMITISLLEIFFQWKNELEDEFGLSGVDIEFSGQRYLTKMNSDLGFLSQSELRKGFYFSKEFDPFLVKSSMLVNQNSSGYVVKNEKMYLGMSGLVYNRVVALEEMMEKNREAEQGLKAQTNQGQRTSEKEINENGRKVSRNYEVYGQSLNFVKELGDEHQKNYCRIQESTGKKREGFKKLSKTPVTASSIGILCVDHYNKYLNKYKAITKSIRSLSLMNKEPNLRKSADLNRKKNHKNGLQKNSNNSEKNFFEVKARPRNVKNNSQNKFRKIQLPALKNSEKHSSASQAEFESFVKIEKMVENDEIAEEIWKEILQDYIENDIIRQIAYESLEYLLSQVSSSDSEKNSILR